ncbi:hypothetical protein DJ022_11655, partial [Acinetobacter radioresistens]|nr:hypothetical protein [Acinetobacter radioresistens]
SNLVQNLFLNSMFIYSHLILVRYSNFKELTPRGLINYILVILKCLRMVFKVRVINRSVIQENGKVYQPSHLSIM